MKRLAMLLLAMLYGFLAVMAIIAAGIIIGCVMCLTHEAQLAVYVVVGLVIWVIISKSIYEVLK